MIGKITTILPKLTHTQPTHYYEYKHYSRSRRIRIR